MYPLEAYVNSGKIYSSDELLDIFLDYADGEGLTLYQAQEDAILALFGGGNVILNTPTGSGKSLVAVALHFWSMANKRTSYYTCPIKALVNEKFIALCKVFGPKNVGMATGDATVNPGASIICCTAEILSNLALREGEGSEVHDVIMDEFHYYADRDRGVAWQVPLLTLPYSRFLLMSATIGDTDPFKKILEDLTHKECEVIKNQERPVPLEFDYQMETMHQALEKLVDSGKTPIYLVNFTQRECAEHAQNLLSIEMAPKEEKTKIKELLKQTKFNSPYGKELRKVLAHGVGIHHAGMLPKYRLAVEKLAQNGLLKVICGTDTLGVGVNIPIRSVLFSKLCKFDGQKVGILSVRDFQQISGRAGRRGFDDQGSVVVLAPEHVVENKIQENKIGDDPKKLKKFKRKPAPTRGFVHWDETTFERLRDSDPELLRSSFKVNYGMVLNVLSRHENGCLGMKRLLRSCHESDAIRSRLRRQSFKLVRSLLEKNLIEFVDDDSQDLVPEHAASKASLSSVDFAAMNPVVLRKKRVQIKVELQDDFSLFQDLGIWLVDAIPLLEVDSETYDLDLMSFVEAVTENPKAILLRQLDKIKGDKINELKQRGVDYDERMEIIEGLSYPKPNADLIYESFNRFANEHPWIGSENIRPKSIAREMYENFMNFDEYVKEYGLQRSEGLLLRYLTEVYKILLQSVPENFRSDSVNEMILFVRTVITQVDNSLMAEWEKLLNPDLAVEKLSEAASPKQDEMDITANKRGFTVLVRNESHRILRALAHENYRGLLGFVEPTRPDQGIWQERHIHELMECYRSDHQAVLVDRNSRAPELFVLKWDDERCTVEQTLTDPEDKNDWTLKFYVDLARSRTEQRVVVFFEGVFEIS